MLRVNKTRTSNASKKILHRKSVREMGYIPYKTTVLMRDVLNVQGAPLVTEPGISLIILTPMKILQRNLNRSTFFSSTFLTQ